VLPGERPSGLRVVEHSIGPTRSVVTSLASGREPGLRVIRIVRVVVILHVTRGTRGSCQVVVPVNVTLCAGEICVRSGQWKAGDGVVKLRITPGSCVVANLAGLRYPGLDVIGIGRALIVLQMAGHAACVGEMIVVVDVALRAWRSHVLPGEGKASS